MPHGSTSGLRALCRAALPHGYRAAGSPDQGPDAGELASPVPRLHGKRGWAIARPSELESRGV